MRCVVVLTEADADRRARTGELWLATGTSPVGACVLAGSHLRDSLSAGVVLLSFLFRGGGFVMAILFSARYINFGAAATAIMLTLGMVTVTPERLGPVSLRTEVARIQLQAAALSTQVAALANTTTPRPEAATAATGSPASPQASAVGTTDPLTAIATAAIAAVAAPIWYVAFPVTLPLSVIGGMTIFSISSLWITAVGGTPDPGLNLILGAAVGLGFFAVGPLGVALNAIASLIPGADPFYPFTFTPAASQPPATPASALTPNETAVPVTTDQESIADRGTSGIAAEPASSQSKREQAATHRDTTAATSAAVTAAPSVTDPSVTVTQGTTTSADEPVVPTRSDLVSEVATASATSDPQESASPSAVTHFTGPKRAIATTPSGQRGDNSATARTGRAVSS